MSLCVIDFSWCYSWGNYCNCQIHMFFPLKVKRTNHWQSDFELFDYLYVLYIWYNILYGYQSLNLSPYNTILWILWSSKNWQELNWKTIIWCFVVFPWSWIWIQSENVDELVQEKCNCSALLMGWCLSCTKPSMWWKTKYDIRFLLQTQPDLNQPIFNNLIVIT